MYPFIFGTGQNTGFITGRTGPLLLRLSLFFGLSAGLAGCMQAGAQHAVVDAPIRNAAFASMYGERPNERFVVPATDVTDLDPHYLRKEVDYPRREEAGTLVIDTANRHLYLVRHGGRALRYGIGVGKEGLAWSGRASVGRKAEWPRWTPTAAMIAREPERNAKWRGGMQPGLENPLGARALYLHEGGRDTLYRIHGTNEPDTIGTDVSSGCIRMFNQDVMDLFDRVPVGTKVVVLPPSESIAAPDAMVADARRKELQPDRAPGSQAPSEGGFHHVDG